MQLATNNTPKLTPLLAHELMPYQAEGVEFLAQRDVGFLLDQQGLGKTPTAIRAADAIGALTINIVCPAIGRIMWQRAFARWATELHSVRVFSYNELATADELPPPADLLILDEAQYVKNQSAKCTQKVYGYLSRGKDCLVDRADVVWLLSGTLTPNGGHELYTHLHALLPQLVTHSGKVLLQWEFVDRYYHWRTDVRTSRMVVTRPREERIGELRQLIAPHFIRRLKKDVLPQLPPLTTEVAVLPGNAPRFTREERQLLANAIEMMERGKDDLESHIPLSTIRRLTGEAKLAPAIEYIREVLEGEEKVVVFAHHRKVIEQLRIALGEFGAVVIQGGMTDKQRQHSIDSFQTNPNVRVCIGQITACNAVIDLTAASREIFVEWSFVPGENAQAAERCHRFTTKNAVLASFLTLPGTLDEAITRIVERKTAAIAALWRS